MPEYLAKIPSSPITGKPMNYSLKPDGTFLLWTPGWNLQSLGGKPGELKDYGDIVRNQPLPMKAQPLTHEGQLTSPTSRGSRSSSGLSGS